MRRMATMALVLAMWPNLAQAADGPAPGVATQSEVEQARRVRDKLSVVEDMQSRKVLTTEAAELAVKSYLEDASGLAHKPLNSVRDLDQFLTERSDFLTKVGRLATFTNIALVVAGILVFVGVVAVIGIYAAAILILIPKEVYEILLYIVCATLIFKAYVIGAWMGLDPVWFAFPACLGLMGALWVTYGLHMAGRDYDPFQYGVLYWGRSRKGDKGVPSFTTFSSLVCFFIWGATAVWFQSELLAFITTMAAMTFLGFSFFVAPFVIGVGYDDEALIPRTGFASFLIMLVGLSTRISGVDLGRFSIFAWSFIWLGTFVYFTTLLITANKWYSKENYILLTLLTVGSGIAALYFGTMFDIPVLQSMGGTFFFIWLTEKYFEIPWGSKGWAWGMLIGGVLLYYAAGLAKKHPEYFLFQGVPKTGAVTSGR